MKPLKARKFTAAVGAEMQALWDTMQITDVRRFQGDLAKCKNGRSLYARLGERLGIPWWFIAAIHGMECAYNFTRHLHNGDSLAARTKLVPAGRPAKGEPPFTWEESAEDALVMKGYHRVKDWSMPHALWLLELYNGLGYRLYKGIPSPYLWAGTNHYTRGKYVRDGVWDKNAVSRQSGCAGLVRLLEAEGAL